MLMLSVLPVNGPRASRSPSGVVNVYRAEDLGRSATSGFLSSSASPVPVKSLMHLTTKTTSLQFNSSSEVLAFASQRTRDAMRLVSAATLCGWVGASAVRCVRNAGAL